jgi:two-component system, NarL family, nitrate/nitrite response regulator NarL
MSHKGASTVIVGRRPLLREGLRALLQNTCYKIVASTTHASDLKNFRALAGCQPMIIIGVDDANDNVVQAAKDIELLRGIFPESKIIIVAEIRAPTDVQQILALGPNGFIANVASRDILLKLLELTQLDQQAIVLSRPCPIPTDQADKRAESADIPSSNLSGMSAVSFGSKDPTFSKREREILLQLVQGDSNKEIARLYSITESTVKVHLKAILRKVAAHNRTQAAIWAIARGYRSSQASNSSDHPIINDISLTDRPLAKSERGNGSTNGAHHVDSSLRTDLLPKIPR